MNPLRRLSESDIVDFQYIFNLLQQYKGRMKLFDLRSAESFNSVSLFSSININQDPAIPLSVNLQQLTKEKELSRLRRYCIIIGYSPEYTNLSKELFDLLAGLKCREIHLIHDIEKFISRYSFLCDENFREKTFPNEIIPGFLYLGSGEHAHSYEIVDVLKVTHILNATKSLPSPFGGVRYCRVDIEDHESEKIGIWFEEAYQFIEEALKMNEEGERGVVLVHCAKGVSRSATLVIMYLMRATSMSLEEAFKFIKRHREIIEPNDGFMSELQEFEKNNREFARLEC